LLLSAAGCFMFFPLLKRKLYPKISTKFQWIWQWGEAVFLLAAVVVSLGLLFKTGTVTFMYQQ